MDHTVDGLCQKKKHNKTDVRDHQPLINLDYKSLRQEQWVSTSILVQMYFYKHKFLWRLLAVKMWTKKPTISYQHLQEPYLQPSTFWHAISVSHWNPELSFSCHIYLASHLCWLGNPQNWIWDAHLSQEFHWFSVSCWSSYPFWTSLKRHAWQ